MNRYAANTSVSVERSKAELDKLLAAAGAKQRGLLNDETTGMAIVMFTLQGRQVKLSMSIPGEIFIAGQAAVDPPRGWKGWKEAARAKWVRDQHQQAERQRWRGLLLCVKAKLELIADGSSTLEREFLSDILMPDGRTIGETILPRIAQAYESGQMPRLLPTYTGGQTP